MHPHQERIRILRDLLEVCHKNQWTYDTKAIADRIAPYIKSMGFNPATVRTYVSGVVDLLLIEKRTGKPWSYGA